VVNYTKYNPRTRSQLMVTALRHQRNLRNKKIIKL